MIDLEKILRRNLLASNSKEILSAKYLGAELMKISLLLITLFASQCIFAQSRLFCSGSVFTTDPSLNTLRTDANSQYKVPTFYFADESNRPFVKIYDFLPVYSSYDELKSIIYLLAEQKNGSVSLYEAELDFGSRKVTSRKISPSRKPTGLSIYDSLSYPVRFLSGDNQILFPAESQGDYKIWDRSKKQFTTVALGSELANPRFSSDQSILLFDTIDYNSSRVQQKAFAFTKKNMGTNHSLTLMPPEIPLPPADKNNHQILMDKSGSSLVWVEVAKNLHSTTLMVQSDKAGTQKLREFTIQKMALPLVTHFISTEKVEIVFPVHEIVPARDEYGPTEGQQVKSGYIQFVTWDPLTGSTQDTKVTYPAELVSRIEKSFIIPSGIMNGILYEASSSSYIFSLGLLGQSLKYNRKQDSWTFLGFNNFRCFNPKAIAEVN